MYLNVSGQQVYAYTGNRPLDTSQPSAVFLHGAANDHSVWSLQSRYFAWHGWNALALDLPGHGKSQGRAMSRVDQLAQWVIAVMDAADIKRFAVAGHSMGSLVGLELAGSYPARVTSLAMIGTAVPMPVSDTLLNTSAANDHVAYEMINTYAHSARAKFGGNRMPGMWMMGNSMRLMERSADSVLHTDFTACNSYAGGIDAADRVTCPVLLLLGQRDQMTPPRAAQQLAGKLPNAKTIVLNGTGHSLMSEQPDAVLDALIRFFAADAQAAGK